jgi:hypothetical protein
MEPSACLAVPTRRLPEVRKCGHERTASSVSPAASSPVESRTEVVELALEHGPVDVSELRSSSRSVRERDEVLGVPTAKRVGCLAARPSSSSAYAWMVSSIVNRGSPSGCSSCTSRLLSISVESVVSSPVAGTRPRRPRACIRRRTRRAAVKSVCSSARAAVAPVDRRAERLPALGLVARPAGEQVESAARASPGAPAERAASLWRPASSIASGKPVEPHADLGHRGRVRVGDPRSSPSRHARARRTARPPHTARAPRRRADGSGREAGAAAPGVRARPERWRGVRLVASSFSCGAPASRVLRTGVASSRCSRLSSTRQRLPRCRGNPRVEAVSLAPIVCPIVGRKSAGSATGSSVTRVDALRKTPPRARLRPAARAASCPRRPGREASAGARRRGRAAGTPPRAPAHGR